MLDNFDRQKEQPSIEICLSIQFRPSLFTFCYWMCFLLVIKETRVQSECSKIKESSLDKWNVRNRIREQAWTSGPSEFRKV